MIGQLIVPREFDSADDLASERERALMSADALGSASGDTTIRMESFAPFPFLPPVTARDYGGTFEFRTYFLKPGGLPGTMAGWRDTLRAEHYVAGLWPPKGGPERLAHGTSTIARAEPALPIG